MAARRTSREDPLAKAASFLTQVREALNCGDALAAAAAAAGAGEYLAALLTEPPARGDAAARQRLTALQVQVRRSLAALDILLRLNGALLAQLVAANDAPSAYRGPLCADAAPPRVALQQWEA